MTSILANAKVSLTSIHHHHRCSHHHDHVDLENTGSEPIGDESESDAGDAKTKSQNLIFHISIEICIYISIKASCLFVSHTFRISELLESWIETHGLKIKLMTKVQDFWTLKLFQFSICPDVRNIRGTWSTLCSPPKWLPPGSWWQKRLKRKCQCLKHISYYFWSTVIQTL